MGSSTKICCNHLIVIKLTEEKIIAVCGLVCSDCKILNAPHNPEIAKELETYFEGQWENVKMEDFHCNGCRNAEDCWSDDCWIRDCCVLDKKLNYCYECQEFPCDKLKKRGKKNEGYKAALNNLKEMKKKSEIIT